MKILSDLRNWLDKTAHKIANDEEDPERWDTPVLYLLETLENEAERNEGDDIAYENMLLKVKDAISDWQEDRTWGY
jgi:hypothetical protein